MQWRGVVQVEAPAVARVAVLAAEPVVAQAVAQAAAMSVECRSPSA
ncbi:MAG TPA: hypothetical protein VFZ04_22195 [Longimicrobiales bacterium]